MNEEKENEKIEKIIYSDSNLSESMKGVLNSIQPIMDYKKAINEMFDGMRLAYSSILDTVNYEVKLLNYTSELFSKIVKENSEVLSKTIKFIFEEYKLENNIFSKYENYFSQINVNKININTDGTIQYEDEKITLSDEKISECVDILKKIEGNTEYIKENTNPKNIILAIVIFIVTCIASGFFNKIGENIYDLIPSAYEQYISKNNIENNEESKSDFIEKYRIVNANELNVREEPSSDSLLIGKLYLNECVEVIEKINYWTKIRYENKEKGISIVGWVFSRYLSLFDEKTSSLIIEGEKLE